MVYRREKSVMGVICVISVITVNMRLPWDERLRTSVYARPVWASVGWVCNERGSMPHACYGGRAEGATGPEEKGVGYQSFTERGGGGFGMPPPKTPAPTAPERGNCEHPLCNSWGRLGQVGAQVARHRVDAEPDEPHTYEADPGVSARFPGWLSALADACWVERCHQQQQPLLLVGAGHHGVAKCGFIKSVDRVWTHRLIPQTSASASASAWMRRKRLQWACASSWRLCIRRCRPRCWISSANSWVAGNGRCGSTKRSSSAFQRE